MHKTPLYELDWSAGQTIGPLQSAMDVFGDLSFWAIHTPGHSASHLSYLLFSTDGPILLTGDASHTRYGFEQGIEPGWASERNQAVSSLEQLRELKRQYPQIRVIYGHEQ